MMNDIQKRFLLFLIGCIVIRSFFVYLARELPIKYLRIMGYIFLIPAFGFMYIFSQGLRKTGPEVFGNEIWWNDLRPIHSILYFCFSYFAIYEKRNIAWIFLFIDVIIGLTSFLLYHYKVKSFKNIINGI
jgi:hypothetical protein